MQRKSLPFLRPWLLLLLVTLGTFVFLKHDAFLYTQPIAQVTDTKITEANEVSDQFGNQVTQSKQAVAATLLNGPEKGQSISLEHEFDTSGALYTKLQPKEQLFVLHREGQTWQVQNLKRDHLWIPMLVFILGAMFILFGKNSYRIALATLMNVCLFMFFLFLDLKLPNPNVFQVFIVFALGATLLTTGIILGFKSRSAWIINLTVITTSIVTMALSFLVFYLTGQKGIYYEHMDFVTQDPASLFLAMTLVGLLGAVLDEATDITVTIDALLDVRPDMSWQAIVQAGREVGQTIFGALNNVLLLIFIAEQIPLAVLYLRNGNSWDYTFKATLSLGFIQTLISAIGIVITVPICLGFILLFRRKRGGH